MGTKIVAVAVEQNAAVCASQLLGLQNAQASQDACLCILDAQAPPNIQGVEIFLAQDLFASKAEFFNDAFFFSQIEMQVLSGLLLAKQWLSAGHTVLWLQNASKAVEQAFLQLVPQADGVALCRAPKEQAPWEANDFPTMLPQISSAAILLWAGTSTISWVNWCIDKLRFLANRAFPVLQPWEREAGAVLTQRDFTAQWQSTAEPFGCPVVYVQEKCSFLKNETKQENEAFYRYNFFTDGTLIPQLLRDWYGKDYRLRQRCQGNPFAQQALFTQVSDIPGDTHPVPIPPILEACYWRRPDLQKDIPEHTGRHREAAVSWLLGSGYAELGMPESTGDALRAMLVAYQRESAEQAIDRRSLAQKIAGRLKRLAGISPVKAQQVENKLPFGVNLCGFILGDFGLGESARILARILETTNIPYTIVDFQGVANHRYTNEEFAHKITNTFPYSVNVFDTNGDGLTVFLRGVSPEVLENRYNIGYWAWELPEFPQDGWADALTKLDEIWACSDFSAKAIATKAQIPVITVPHAITMEAVPSCTRAEFGLPVEPFLFVMMYDVRSFSARKNPQAAVEAFLKAFAGNAKVALVLKLNIPADWDGEDGLLEALKTHENIILYPHHLSKERLNAFISCCDATVSLHCSEGFGLGPAEAMALGKPAVLTNWSGNTQYMRADACCPVAYTVVEIDQDYGPYKKGCHWAKADTDDAAQWMRRLVEDRTFYNQIAQAGKALIEAEFSPAAIGKTVSQRLELVRT